MSSALKLAGELACHERCEGLSLIGRHRISHALDYLLYFVCSDDKTKPDEPSSMGPKFWKALVDYSSLTHIWQVHFACRNQNLFCQKLLQRVKQ